MPSQHLGTFAISHEASFSCVTFVSESKIIQEQFQILKLPEGHKHGVSMQSSENLGDNFAKNARMKDSRDLILVELVYISIIYRIPGC